jgi:hypothetical protein
MNKKLFYSVFALVLVGSPLLTHAQTADTGTDWIINLIAHGASIVFSLVAALYLVTLTSAFRGGLLEKIWRSLSVIAFLFAALSIVSVLQERALLPRLLDQLNELIQIVIAVIFISLSRTALKGIMK